MRNRSFVRGLWVLPLAVSLLCGAASGADRVITNEKHKERMGISVTYPDDVGHPEVDAAVRNWAVQKANDFMARALQEAPGGTPCTLQVVYELSRPSDRAVSVVWIVSSSTKGAGKSAEIHAQSYDLQSGRRLELKDLFAHPKAAVQQLAAFSVSTLMPKLREQGEDVTHLVEGAGPHPKNFANFVLIPTGLRVEFPPAHVASLAAGGQRVDVPLEEFVHAKPRMELWGR